MPHLITAHEGKDHVFSSNAAHCNAASYGPGKHVLNFGRCLAATMTTTNIIRVLDGIGLVDGRFWEIEDAFEEFTIENGTPGYKRTDLLVAHIERAPVESIDIRVLKGEETTGTPVPPSYIEGDLNAGDTIVEQPLWAITLDGINPGEPVAQFEVSPSFMEAWDSQSQTLPDGTAVLRFGDIIVLTGMVEQQFATSSSLLHITAAVPIVVRKVISGVVSANAIGDPGCEPHYTNCWANPTDTRCEAYVLSGISNPKVRMSYVIFALV